MSLKALEPHGIFTQSWFSGRVPPRRRALSVRYPLWELPLGPRPS